MNSSEASKICTQLFKGIISESIIFQRLGKYMDIGTYIVIYLLCF